MLWSAALTIDAQTSSSRVVTEAANAFAGLLSILIQHLKL